MWPLEDTPRMCTWAETHGKVSTLNSQTILTSQVSHHNSSSRIPLRCRSPMESPPQPLCRRHLPRLLQRSLPRCHNPQIRQRKRKLTIRANHECRDRLCRFLRRYSREIHTSQRLSGRAIQPRHGSSALSHRLDMVVRSIRHDGSASSGPISRVLGNAERSCTTRHLCRHFHPRSVRARHRGRRPERDVHVPSEYRV